MAKKVTKKKNRKLRRQIRKTVGALLMVSAIAVAAVPVQDISANPTVTNEKIKVAVTSSEGEIQPGDAEHEYESTVPYAQKSTNPKEQIVYTSGDGMFQFAFTYIDTTRRGAVILNFENVTNSSTITIPEELEAYRKYAPNYSNQGYCLVSISDELLGYRVQEHLTTPEGKALYQTVNYMPNGSTVESKIDLIDTDLYWNEELGRYQYRYEQTIAGGDPQTVTCDVEPVMGWKYYPCFYNQKSNWENYTDEQLYYLPKNDDGSDNYTADWQPATTNDHWRVLAEVAYIGGEYITETQTGWTVQDYRVHSNEGVFSDENQVTNLIFEGNISGISDYTFSGCWNLATVEFKSGIETIGNGAFANCGNLRSVTIPQNAEVTAIGKDAFYGCKSLTSFSIPTGLIALGDCAFEECTSLTSVNLTGDGTSSMRLTYLGNHLFRGCESLSGITFPDGYSETLDLDIFAGCRALQYVKIPNTTSGANLNFDVIHAKDTASYPNCGNDGSSDTEKEEKAWDIFRNTVPESFYFEGPEVSAIHTTANDNSITYKYPGQELYEKVVYEHDRDDINPDDRTAKTIYQVNDQGTLVKFDILDKDLNVPSHPDVITIPETIGAFGIKHIGAGSFNDNCDLIKVTIPASVETIGDNAFRGCHNLRTVIFTDATTITSIGTDAFQTQETHCSDDVYPDAAEEPSLYFVGAMLNSDGGDTETFKYAMNGTSKISHDDSPDFWITCHSGWPTNLEVEYYREPNAATGEAQLVGYPRYDEISSNVSDWVDDLPYVTSDTEKQYYANMIDRAIQFNGGQTISPNLTPNEEAFLAATLHLTIPESVDSIQEGLFSGYDSEGSTISGKTPDTTIESITINGVDTIDSYAFKGCTKLQSADIIGSTFMDDYAFEDCTGLQTVTLGSNLTDTGKRPFKGCSNLNSINCLDPSNFVYNSGILYRQTDTGLEIVECLENRGKTGGTGLYTVGPDELSGVSAIKPEAFADCKDVSRVDLSATTVDTITEGSFQNMNLNSIVLPNTLNRIESDAFTGGESRRFIVYYKNSNPIYIAADAFEPLNGDPDVVGDSEVIFQCAIPSNADTYALDYAYITTSDEEVYEEFTVCFYNTPDYPASTNLELLSRQTVRSGEDAQEPDTEDLTCNDTSLVFIGWNRPFTNVQGDLDILAMYGSPQYTVTFIDGYTGDILKTETVSNGGTATPPEPPEHEGYTFSQWSRDWFNITESCTISALYVDNSGDSSRHTVTFYDWDGTLLYTQYVNDGENAIEPKSPTRSGYTFTGWIPASNLLNVTENRLVAANYTLESAGSNNGSGSSSTASPSASSSASSSASASASPSASPEVTKYTVSVSGGSGSGSYAAGEIVAINAYYMGEGQAFDRWTTSTAGVGFANANATSTTFTMPAANVAITATYKTGSGSSTSTGTGSSGGSSTGSSGSTSNNGTTVEVTRPGISNTNLAGATVSGATDNFVVKITEDQTATDAVVAALQARYGDISRIMYLPMDISLYDSTGRVKIADTTGITVNLTLPIPDDLVQYAGNNKVAAVSGGALEDLNVRFTTVNGVSCVNFTATHFSPYVIYVDTANLTEATIDATPQTGDPIHPKWFLALGLACVSLILFTKRDKVVVNTKTA